MKQSAAPSVHQIAKRLKSQLHAEQVWLFGSKARNDGDADSDTDLLAVIPSSNQSRYQRAVAARRILSEFRIPIDIIVMTQAEWLRELKAPSSLASTVAREGIAI